MIGTSVHKSIVRFDGDLHHVEYLCVKTPGGKKYYPMLVNLRTNAKRPGHVAFSKASQAADYALRSKLLNYQRFLNTRNDTIPVA